ncbi:hypothetical protein EVA_09619 [gut metagenome]|uniref:Uncharacterized protein n=1 Tax=gut metagenome TaxID=749906 RepID=J9GJQ4_9ZZZZ
MELFACSTASTRLRICSRTFSVSASMASSCSVSMP